MTDKDKQEIRKLLNNLVQDCQDMDSHIETVNLSIGLAVNQIAKIVNKRMSEEETLIFLGTETINIEGNFITLENYIGFGNTLRLARALLGEIERR